MNVLATIFLVVVLPTAAYAILYVLLHAHLLDDDDLDDDEYPAGYWGDP